MRMKRKLYAWVTAVIALPLCVEGASISTLHSRVAGDRGYTENAPKYKTYVLEGQTYEDVKLSLERGFLNDMYASALESHAMDSLSWGAAYYYRNNTQWGLTCSDTKTYYAVMLHSSDAGVDYYAVFPPEKASSGWLTFSMVNGSPHTGWLSYVERTKTDYRAVPYEWLKSYYPTVQHNYDAYENLAKSTSANGRDSIGDCYVAGLVPTNSASVFRATLRMDNNTPIVGHSPELSAEETAKRKYTTLGKLTLKDYDWAEVPAGSEADYNFFKVTVEMLP